MKLTHKVCGAVLVAVVGVALVAPNTTKASPSVYDGKGHIQYTIDTSDTTAIITDPGSSSGTTITDPSITNPGTFGMIFVTPLDFSKHNIVKAATVRDYKANLYKANPGSTDPGFEEFDVQNFVSWQDYRGQEDHSYKLSAQITKNFQTTGGNVLKGANIEYKNLWLSRDGANTDLDPAGVTTAAMRLTGGNTSTEVGNTQDFVVNNDKTGKGYGRFQINFGTKTDGADSVQLNIPTTTAIGVGDYTATITWTLSDTF